MLKMHLREFTTMKKEKEKEKKSSRYNGCLIYHSSIATKALSAKRQRLFLLRIILT